MVRGLALLSSFWSVVSPGRAHWAGPAVAEAGWAWLGLGLPA